MVIQILLCLPIEFVHGWRSVLIIYFTGVIAGSLGFSAHENPDSKLVGASGAVYAILLAHLANIVIVRIICQMDQIYVVNLYTKANYIYMQFPKCKKIIENFLYIEYL